MSPGHLRGVQRPGGDNRGFPPVADTSSATWVPPSWILELTPSMGAAILELTPSMGAAILDFGIDSQHGCRHLGNGFQPVNLRG
jgi:hypothetical protein